MNITNSTPEIISDSKYFEPNTVRITISGSQHHGKVWQHSHSFYEFVYVEQGFSLHSYNGKTSVLCGGDLFAIFPGDVHSYNSAYHTHIYNCLFYLEELGDLRSEVLKLPGIDWERRCAASPLPIIRVGLSERRELVELLEHMRRERENKAVGWELNLKGLLINFLTMYSRLIGSLPNLECRQDERGYCGYIYAVLKFVEENYTRDITGADIAEFVGLSQDYLSRQFKAAMAMTPVEYVRKFRVAKSIDLLKTTDMSIANIADACGFGDISLYSRVFKQIIGVSPAAFRKE